MNDPTYAERQAALGQMFAEALADALPGGTAVGHLDPRTGADPEKAAAIDELLDHLDAQLNPRTTTPHTPED